jgi:hypothetical protein
MYGYRTSRIARFRCRTSSQQIKRSCSRSIAASLSADGGFALCQRISADTPPQPPPPVRVRSHAHKLSPAIRDQRIDLRVCGSQWELEDQFLA